MPNDENIDEVNIRILFLEITFYFFCFLALRDSKAEDA